MFFNLLHLIETTNKTLLVRLEVRSQATRDDVEGKRGTDDSRSHDEYIHVIMLDALVC